MAQERTQLQSLLEALMESLDLEKNVYFQPPSNLVMNYPCIRNERDDSQVRHANNRLYLHTNRNQVTVIDRNPDSQLPDKVIELPMCAFDRFYVADGLNHHVFNLFF